MAEKIISPGVFTNEIDQTFLPAAVADIGAALIGPTLKGPAGIPTVVTSFSDFQAKFGDVFKSGSDSYQFLTSHAAEEYLKNSNTLTVVRIMAGSFAPATADIGTSGSTTAATKAKGAMTFHASAFGTDADDEVQITFGGTEFRFVAADPAGGIPADSSTIFYFNSGSNPGNFADQLATKINTVSSTVGVTATAVSASRILQLTASTAGIAGNDISVDTGSSTTLSDVLDLSGGTNTGGSTATSFTLETLADGTIMNNASAVHTGSNSLLKSGSKHNIRYEVSNVNNKKGTFTLLIRAGNDNEKRKQTLETFNNCSLDPNSNNYIAKVIGDQKQAVQTDDGVKYLQLTGSFANKSRFVRVKSVATPLIDYLDENGDVTNGADSASLPNAGSGSSNGGFSGATDGLVGFDALGNANGDVKGVNFYENIGAQSQGFTPASTSDANGGAADAEALDLLANQDDFDINLVLMPGMIHGEHSPITNKAIDMCEDRADCFAVIDPVVYGSTLGAATTQAEAKDSNFAAMYWPWVKVPDSQVASAQRWVPPSVVIGGIYAFNDRVAHPWFAPAGLNRGGITTAIQAERKLTQGNRDTLYDSNVNPIATFPGQGVTVFGQKTLQKKSSALDRINVRRLLIRVKKFIASSSRFLVFEQNTAATRRRFLGIVNPFLENVQSQSGLSAFRVVMDETNNTPDTIDRNQLIGQLFLQPTRTAEFIVLDFTIQPTGASFPE